MFTSLLITPAALTRFAIPSKLALDFLLPGQTPIFFLSDDCASIWVYHRPWTTTILPTA